MVNENGLRTGIDVHGHGVPRTFLEGVARSRAAGVDVVFDGSSGSCVVTFPGHRALRAMPRSMLDFRDRLAWLDAQGMWGQVVAPWLDVDGQELDAGRGRDWVRRLNEAMAEAVAGSEGRLLAHATLHMADANGAARELVRCREELGITGCMIPTHFPTGQLTDPRYDALWEAAQGLRIPIVLHPTTTGPASRFEGMEDFRSLFGRLIDTTTAASQLILSGIFDRFRDLRLVLVHGGGFLPYQTGRLDAEQAVRANRWGVGRILSDYVGCYYFDTVLMSGWAIRFLLDLAGSERVVIGSDYPFTAEGPPLTQALHEATAESAARAAVGYETARRLYAMEPARASV